MKTLRTGSKGPLVRKWQYFLLGQGFYQHKVDGQFGPYTREATQQFQQQYGLPDDGVVGNRTMGQAMLLGFALLGDNDMGMPGPNWPAVPQFTPLTSTEDRCKLFGKFTYRSQPIPGNPENIVVTDGWEGKNIVTIDIPQIGKVNNGRTKVRFHRLAVKQLQGLWEDWEKAGMLDSVLSWQGAYVPRFIRGSRRVLSNHAFGTAFDINAQWNGLGVCPALVGQPGCVRELVGIAHQHGFYWGGHFTGRPDGMHFEVAVLK